MKRWLPFIIVLCLLLSACAPEAVREGGLVLRGEPSEAPVLREGPPTGDETVVYVTKSGKKYHTADCSYLTDSAFPVALEQAIAEGKTPCSRCHPDAPEPTPLP